MKCPLLTLVAPPSLQQASAGGVRERLSFVHAAAENTGLPSGSVDLVSICLVFHELPQSATRAVLQEAFRVLRPGGALAIMEMDPTTGEEGMGGMRDPPLCC